MESSDIDTRMAESLSFDQEEADSVSPKESIFFVTVAASFGIKTSVGKWISLLRMLSRGLPTSEIQVLSEIRVHHNLRSAVKRAAPLPSSVVVEVERRIRSLVTRRAEANSDRRSLQTRAENLEGSVN